MVVVFSGGGAYEARKAYASPNFGLDILGEYIVSKPVVRGSSEQEVTSSVIENYRIVLTGK